MSKRICVFGASITWGACDYEVGGWVARLRKYIETFMPITVSIGVANFKGNAQNTVGLIYKADRALYQAKANGRNRVEIYTGE